MFLTNRTISCFTVIEEAQAVVNSSRPLLHSLFKLEDYADSVDNGVIVELSQLTIASVKGFRRKLNKVIAQIQMGDSPDKVVNA
jgi:hypothetical protein